MALIVQKFGGSVLNSERQFIKIAHSIACLHRQGHQLVVVVSALKGMTDRLLRKAQRINPHMPKGQSLDLLLSLGEQQSCALLGLALDICGIPVNIKSGALVGLYRTKQHQWYVDVSNYLKALKKNVVVVSGFQALDERKHLITLERGGSDLTALILSHVLKADRCQLIKDVPGIATMDPQCSTKGRTFLKKLSLNDLLTISQGGSDIVQAQAIQFAQQHRVNFEVTDLHNHGTYVYA
jgi:aspartate kinase